MALRDYHQQLVHFPFVKTVRGMPEDFYIGFDLFDALLLFGHQLFVQGFEQLSFSLILRDPGNLEQLVFLLFQLGSACD